MLKATHLTTQQGLSSWWFAEGETVENWEFSGDFILWVGDFQHMSHEKNPYYFPYTGWLIRILIVVYYNPYITG